jgi:protein-tyrosine phosphatase
MFTSILVVCTGNICRSPTAERLLRKKLPSKQVDSAGTRALQGKAADQLAANVSLSHGVSLAGHQGRQFTRDLARNYSLILVMEKQHLKQVTQIAPEARGKTMLLSHWQDGGDIIDPYQKGIEAFEFVYQLIDQATHDWAEKLAC